MSAHEQYARRTLLEQNPNLLREVEELDRASTRGETAPSGVNHPASEAKFDAAPAEESAHANWPASLAPEAFYGLAGELVHAIEPHSEADPAALLIQVLVAYGNIIGRNAHWYAESTRHALNLNAVLVGASSKARKGTSWNRTHELFARVDPDWRVHSGGLSSAEGFIWAVRDGHDGDGDDKKADPGVQDKRLVVVEEEFASALRVMERPGNALSPILRQAWDGLTLSPVPT